MAQQALFLARDGVINIDFGYVYERSKFVFIDGIFDLVRFAKERNFLIFIITNQSGIGRGYYTIEEFEALSSWMLAKFKSEGAEIDKLYFSPYHPIHGKGSFLKDDPSRKPNPGMIVTASSEYTIDLARSVLIGDKVSDIEAGQRAGVGRNILLTNLLYYNKYECVSNLKDVLNILAQLSKNYSSSQK